MKISPDQDISVITELELIHLVHDAYPELWRNLLKRSNSKLVDMSVEQLVRCVEEFDDTPKPDPRIKNKMKSELLCFVSIMVMAITPPTTVTSNDANENRR